MRHPFLAVLILIGADSSAVVSADEPVKPVPELRVLEPMIGAWDEVVTYKPAEWTPKADRQASVTKKTWTLGGKFLRMEGAWNPAKTEFASLLTYDANSKEYRHWYFDSTGSFLRGTPHGKWDDRTRTMTWTSTDEDGNKSVGKTKIIDNDTHEWTVVITSPNGKLMLDLYAKNTRRKE